MELEFYFLEDPNEIQKAGWHTQHKVEGKPFTPKTFQAYLLAEHSPIRRLVLAWRIKDLSKRAMNHLVRHVHTQPYIPSSRPDLFPDHTGEEVVDALFDSNCEALIAIARKRLCYRTFIDTRRAIEQLKYELMSTFSTDKDQTYYSILGSMMVPNCIYRCGCPEGTRSCGWWTSFASRLAKEELVNIKLRYIAYNKLFWGARKELP